MLYRADKNGAGRFPLHLTFMNSIFRYLDTPIYYDYENPTKTTRCAIVAMRFVHLIDDETVIARAGVSAVGDIMLKE